MNNNRIKVLSAVMCAVFLLSLAMPIVTTVAAEGEDLLSRDIKGIKGVAKGKPDKPPGKPPKDEEPDPEPDPDPEPTVDKWAVVIGIADYKGRGNDLTYTDDDAVDMYNYLMAKGYPASNVRLLLDRNAKADKILQAIDWLGQNEGPASEVVFFYSGHGSTIDGYNDGDAEYTDETIVSHDLYHIVDGQLRDSFSTFESSKISFIFDSCFSGGMNDLAGPGRVVVTGGSETQYTWDGAAWMANGVFTYYYMEGLYNFNTIEGAFAYATPLAHDFVQNNYEAQMDPLIFDNFVGDWAF